MNLYLDSSGIVKRYLEERGSAEVEARLREASLVASSLIAYAEVASAIAGARRRGDVRVADADAAWRLFHADWDDLAVLAVEPSTVEAAAALVREHDLRGFDAIHLATALGWQRQIGSPVTMATFDRRLWHSAQAAGLDAWPEDLEL